MSTTADDKARRELVTRAIYDLYGAPGENVRTNTGDQIIVDLLEEMGLDALTTEALEKLADLHSREDMRICRKSELRPKSTDIDLTPGGIGLPGSGRQRSPPSRCRRGRRRRGVEEGPMAEVTKEEHLEALRVSRQGALKIMDSVRSFLATNHGRFVTATGAAGGGYTTAVRRVAVGYMLDNWFDEQMTFNDRKSADAFAKRWNAKLTEDQRGIVSVSAMSAEEYHSEVIAQCETNIRFLDELLARD